MVICDQIISASDAARRGVEGQELEAMVIDFDWAGSKVSSGPTGRAISLARATMSVLPVCADTSNGIECTPTSTYSICYQMEMPVQYYLCSPRLVLFPPVP